MTIVEVFLPGACVDLNSAMVTIMVVLFTSFGKFSSRFKSVNRPHNGHNLRFRTISSFPEWSLVDHYKCQIPPIFLKCCDVYARYVLSDAQTAYALAKVPLVPCDAPPALASLKTTLLSPRSTCSLIPISLILSNRTPFVMILFVLFTLPFVPILTTSPLEIIIITPDASLSYYNTQTTFFQPNRSLPIQVNLPDGSVCLLVSELLSRYFLKNRFVKRNDMVVKSFCVGSKKLLHFVQY